MKKLSVSLKESRFVDLINKKFTGEIRKEDMIGNLQRLKPVDIGTSVLWADDDLCVNNKYLFTFDEVTNMLKDSEWRLPTVSEVKELQKYKKEYRNGEYIFTNNGTYLTFYPHGFIYDPLPSKETAQKSDIVMGWTGDVSKYNNNYICTYIINRFSITGRNISFGISFGTTNVKSKSFLLSVRLVKDR